MLYMTQELKQIKEYTMDELIWALQLIRSKMPADVHNPTNCDHDEFSVYVGVDVSDFTPDELVQLEACGFDWDEDFERFVSYRFGSC